jgi:hypothetical protein
MLHLNHRGEMRNWNSYSHNDGVRVGECSKVGDELRLRCLEEGCPLGSIYAPQHEVEKIDRRRNILCRHHPGLCVVSGYNLGHMYGGLDTWQRLSDAMRPSLNLAEVAYEALHFPSVVLHYLVRAPVFSRVEEAKQKPVLWYILLRFGAL